MWETLASLGQTVQGMLIFTNLKHSLPIQVISRPYSPCLEVLATSIDALAMSSLVVLGGGLSYTCLRTS